MSRLRYFNRLELLTESCYCAPQLNLFVGLYLCVHLLLLSVFGHHHVALSFSLLDCFAVHYGFLTGLV